jgi:hypothetical protein
MEGVPIEGTMIVGTLEKVGSAGVYLSLALVDESLVERIKLNDEILSRVIVVLPFLVWCVRP